MEADGVEARHGLAGKFGREFYFAPTIFMPLFGLALPPALWAVKTKRPSPLILPRGMLTL